MTKLEDGLMKATEEKNAAVGACRGGGGAASDSLLARSR